MALSSRIMNVTPRPERAEFRTRLLFSFALGPKGNSRVPSVAFIKNPFALEKRERRKEKNSFVSLLGKAKSIFELVH